MEDLKGKAITVSLVVTTAPPLIHMGDVTSMKQVCTVIVLGQFLFLKGKRGGGCPLKLVLMRGVLLIYDII